MSLYEIEETGYLSLAEVVGRVGSSQEVIISMVEYAIIHPKGQSPETWQFSFKSFQRLQKALRLQRDLDLDVSGVAITLDLVEEIDRLKAEISRLEHFLSLHHA